MTKCPRIRLARLKKTVSDIETDLHTREHVKKKNPPTLTETIALRVTQDSAAHCTAFGRQQNRQLFYVLRTLVRTFLREQPQHVG